MIRRGATAAGLKLDVRDKQDWFDVEGSLEVDGERMELATVLEAVRAQRRFVRAGADR